MTMKSIKYSDCDTIIDSYNPVPPPLPRRAPPIRNIYAEPFSQEQGHHSRLGPHLDEVDQQQVSQAMQSVNEESHCQIPGPSPIVIPTFPIRSSHSIHTPHCSRYSPARFHFDKRCQYRCSWKCFSITLILVAVILTALFAYFAAIGTLRSSLNSTKCVIIQDVKPAIRDQITQNYDTSTGAPTEDSLQITTTDYTTFTTNHFTAPGFRSNSPPFQQQTQSNFQQNRQQFQENLGKQYIIQQEKWPQVVELRSYNEIYHSKIPPYQFWSLEFRNKHPTYVRFNITLPWGANFAVYGRRNVAPSVTQYDFVEFIKGGRLDSRLKKRRRKRQLIAHVQNDHQSSLDKLFDPEFIKDDAKEKEKFEAREISFLGGGRAQNNREVMSCQLLFTCK